jgi:hypothetical protein
VNRLSERRELDALERAPRPIDHGQGEVGIELRVPVPGEVLAASYDSGLREAGGESAAERRDPRRVPAERAIADDRVVRVRVDVEDGGEVARDARGGELATDRATRRSHQHRTARLTKPAHRWPQRERRLESGDASALLIDRNQPGWAKDVAELGRQVTKHSRRADVSREEHDSAWTKLLETPSDALRQPRTWYTGQNEARDLMRAG